MLWLLRDFSTKYNALSPENQKFSLDCVQLYPQTRHMHPLLLAGFPQIQAAFPQENEGIRLYLAFPRFPQFFPRQTSFRPQILHTYPQLFPCFSTKMNKCSQNQLLISDSFPRKPVFFHQGDMLIHSFLALIHRSKAFVLFIFDHRVEQVMPFIILFFLNQCYGQTMMENADGNQFMF